MRDRSTQHTHFFQDLYINLVLVPVKKLISHLHTHTHAHLPTSQEVSLIKREYVWEKNFENSKVL